LEVSVYDQSGRVALPIYKTRLHLKYLLRFLVQFSSSDACKRVDGFKKIKIEKKNTVRKKLRSSPASHLREKLNILSATKVDESQVTKVKLRESREQYYVYVFGEKSN
jgi:hypothetical protein